jgi:hypothetical protein
MMQGGGDLYAAAKKAYPNMSDEDFMKNLNNLLSLETWPQDLFRTN